MISPKSVLFLLAASSFAFGESALIQSLNKCSIKDNQCLKGVYQLLFDTLTSEGAPELDIKKIDPLNIKQETVSILGILNVTLLDGVVEGIKSCSVENYINDIEQTRAKMDISCDQVDISGNYDLEMFGSLVKSAGFGDDLHGNGNGKVTIKKVKIMLDLPYILEKQDDGLHFKIITEDSQYSFDVLDSASFEADNLVIGDKEASIDIVKYLNENWKFILKTFGKTFFGKAMDYVHVYLNKFNEKIALQHFVKEDLSSYLKQ